MSELTRTKPRIAVLEDHDDTREMLKLALESEFSIRDYRSVPELLSALEEDTFSAIITDIMMPGLDGFGLIRSLRADPRFTNLCVIAVTALAMPNERNKGLAAGFTDYLTKPVDPAEIAATVWRHLDSAP